MVRGLASTLLGTVLAATAAHGTQPAIVRAPFGLFGVYDMSWTLGPSFTPGGTTVYFTKSEPSLVGTTIFESRLILGAWSRPEVAPFSGQYADADPAVTPDGGAVIFSSHRPPLGSAAAAALYEAFVRGPRKGTVVPLPNSANALGGESSPSVARDGTLYFIVDAAGIRHIYRERAVSEQPTAASAVLIPGDSSSNAERDVAVDPAQRYLVFSSNRSGGFGGFDLYATFRHGERFCAPVHLPAPVNTAWSEVAPAIGHDGSTLYFSSNRSDFAQPAAQTMSAKAFVSELGHYDDGSVRLHRTDIGTWLGRAGASNQGC